jgi:hypothetical protein
MPRKPVLLVVTLAVFSGGCESTPTTPTNGGTNIVATGSQVLRILSQSPCTQLVPGVLPQVHTRVNVVMSSTEWVATAADAAAGDIQVRFRQSGQSMIRRDVERNRRRWQRVTHPDRCDRQYLRWHDVLLVCLPVTVGTEG